MNSIKIKLTNCLSAISLCVAICLSAVSCDTNELTDGDKFSLFYPGITDIGPSTNIDLTPTYHGEKGSDFKIYRVTLDGADYQTESFLINSENGQVQLRNTAALPIGKYTLSISCVSSGVLYEFPDLISVNMMCPVPEGIVVTPSEIELSLAQVTDMNSLEELPAIQIQTQGEHITIDNYYISKVMRDGVLVEDWSDLFAVSSSGKVSILKNQNFPAGKYVLDFKLTTLVVGKDSEEGIFENALTVDVVAPPISLSYTPVVGKMEVGGGYTSSAPSFVGSLKGLKYTLKSVLPEGAPVSVNSETGVVTVANDNTLAIGESLTVSLSVENAFGQKDFDQVLKIEVVAFIEFITKLDYNDSTVWQNTKFSIKPIEVDGDEKMFSFVDLPESLSALSIDEGTGEISSKKGNGIAQGEYTVTVKVENPKGSLTKDIKLTVVENPYYFTYVSWGNNLGLTPAVDYASQHRVSTTESYKIPVTASDIKPETVVKYEISGGSKTSCASIDETTGEITTLPEYAGGKIDEIRAHFVFVKVTTGEGTPGETSMKIPVFFDFNCPRGNYIVEYTPFAFQCNPKNGGTSAVPVIKKADGTDLTADELANITMDFRRSFNYWNINGPASHANGAPNDAKDNFLSNIWATYYTSINVDYNKGSRDPVSAFGRKFLEKNPCYLRKDDHALYVAPEKWKMDDEYADGIFTGQITFADTGSDPSGAASPYRMFPIFVWFDTEF